MNESGVRERLAGVNQRIAQSCARAGRSISEVTLVGVTKTFAPPIIKEGIEAGLRVLGENRVQEAASKIPELTAICSQYGVSWHLIGHLQTNKARRAVELFDAIQTIDSFKLAQRLSALAGEANKRLPVMIEVNLAGEQTKAGIAPEETIALCEQVAGLDHLELRGLMTVPPFLDDPEELRPFFRRLRRLRDELMQSGKAGDKFGDLSMGMSHDFEVAIEEGSTMVRIGTAIFGARDGK